MRRYIDIIEHFGENRTFFHITLAENLSSIMEHGLQPTVGDRSKQLKERSAIFLFRTQNDAHDALMGWMGEQFDEDSVFALLEVMVPVEIEIHTSDKLDWEVFVREPIPAQCLKITSRDF